MTLRWIALAAVCLGCGPTQYLRGLRTRVEVKKQTLERSLQVHLERPQEDRLEVIVQTAGQTRLERRMVYGTVEVRLEQGSALWELIEMPLGLLMPLVAVGYSAMGYFDLPQGRNVKVDQLSFSLWMLFGWISPVHGVLSNTMVIDPNSDKELFFEALPAARYSSAAPRGDAPARVIVRDLDGRAVRDVRLRTDRYGRAQLGKLPRSALTVEVQIEGAVHRFCAGARLVSAGEGCASR